MAEQVVRQVIDTKRKLDADLDQLPRHKVIRIGYAEFCANPEHLTEVLRKQLGGVPLRNPPMGSFEYRRCLPADTTERTVWELVSRSP